jgi:hypothetical protein
MSDKHISVKSTKLSQILDKPVRWFAIFVIIFAQIIQYVFNPKGTFVGDSFGYGYGPARDWEKFSFFGNSLRNWPIVGINLVLNKPELQILAQSMFSTFAWCLLILSLSKTLKSKHYLLAIISISSLALSPKILSWNSVVLSESYSISLIIILFAMVLKLMRNATLPGKIVFVFTFYLWISLHPRNFVFACLLIIAFVALYFRVFLRFLINNKSVTAIICLILIHAFVVTENQGKQPFGQNITYSQVTAFYTFSNHPSSSQIKAELLRVPEMRCIATSEIEDIFDLVSFASENCQESLSWIDSNFKSWYLQFQAKNPKLVLTLINYGLIAGNSPSNLYAPYISILPIPIDMLFFGDRNFFLGSVNSKSEQIDLESLKVSAPIYLWIAVYFSFFFSFFWRKYYSNLKNREPLKEYLLVLTTWAFISQVSVFLIMPSEHFRLSIQFYLIFIISLISYFTINSTEEGLKPSIPR